MPAAVRIKTNNMVAGAAYSRKKGKKAETSRCVHDYK